MSKIGPRKMSSGASARNEGYERLSSVLEMAYQQASAGKGSDRHGGNDLPFHEQPMQQISQLLVSTDGMAFQAIKKIRESGGLPTTEAQIAELLGAINYVAGIVIYLQDRQEKGFLP